MKWKKQQKTEKIAEQDRYNEKQLIRARKLEPEKEVTTLPW